MFGQNFGFGGVPRTPDVGVVRFMERFGGYVLFVLDGPQMMVSLFGSEPCSISGVTTEMMLK